MTTQSSNRAVGTGTWGEGHEARRDVLSAACVALVLLAIVCVLPVEGRSEPSPAASAEIDGPMTSACRELHEPDAVAPAAMASTGWAHQRQRFRCMAGPDVPSSEPQPPRPRDREEPASPPWISGPPLQALRPEPPGVSLAGRYGHGLDIRAVYQNVDAASPVTLATDGVQRDAMNLNINGGLPGGIKTEAQVAYSAFNSQSDRMYREQRNRMVRFKFSGEAPLMDYGAEYRSVGAGVRRAAGMGSWRLDQEGSESWVQRKFGPISVKGLYQNYWNNVEADPRRPRTVTTLGGTAATLTLPSGPSFTLSYLSGESETRSPRGGAPQQSIVQQYMAMVSYWRDSWDVSALSMVMPSRDKMMPDQQTQSVYHEIGANLRPTPNLYITPYLSYSETVYGATGTKSMNPSAMMSITWTDIFTHVTLNSFLMLQRSKSTDGWINSDSTLIMNSVIYELGATRGERFLSFDVMFTRYSDAVYQDTSYREWIARIMFTIARLK